MIWARRDGALLHARVSGNGPALAFANSLGTDLRLWDDVLDRVSCRAIRWDMRGHGLSPVSPASIEDHAADLAALLDAHAPGGAVVVGVSVGGLVAQALAGARPDLVRALVLSNTGTRIGTRAIWDERIAAVEAGGVDAVADAALARWFTDAWRTANPDAVAGWRCMMTAQPARGYADLGRAIAAADLGATAGGIAVPTLCVGGTGDRATPPDLVEALADAIPGARLAMLDGSGHLPMVDAADAFAKILRAFLKDVA